MTIEEQAKKYGVPTPENCKEIQNDFTETFFSWINLKNAGEFNGWWLCHWDMKYKIWLINGTESWIGANQELLKAPQIHEILHKMYPSKANPADIVFSDYLKQK